MMLQYCVCRGQVTRDCDNTAGVSARISVCFSLVRSLAISGVSVFEHHTVTAFHNVLH